MNTNSTLVIVPTYNERENVAALVEQAHVRRGRDAEQLRDQRADVLALVVGRDDDERAV